MTYELRYLEFNLLILFYENEIIINLRLNHLKNLIPRMRSL